MAKVAPLLRLPALRVLSLQGSCRPDDSLQVAHIDSLRRRGVGVSH